MHASAFSLETSMPTILPCCGILPTPFLARPGSGAQATVRVEGRHRICPSLTRRVRLWWERAQIRRRAAAANSRPSGYFAKNSGHKVGGAANRLVGPPHLTPTLSAPRGGEGVD